ncbi:ProQ/FINO family protein [Citrobacter meridianamericanus]|uniref:ProQ/FINO family protein n=1 Tax=Citrobacter meridianamericanus TaxID=2894201 RepID=A0ABT1BHR1_9ENTR|nr:ProQ/FINO family protein [Citrobacter meridianamericanus]MCO5784594.1 ProQ/FINO family protein [Citrobacter meridianamericanus]
MKQKQLNDSVYRILPGKKSMPTKVAAEVAGDEKKCPQAHLSQLKKTLSDKGSAELLKHFWPGLFDHGHPRPLTQGIFEQLLDDVRHFELPVSGRELRQSLKRLMRSEAYLQAVRAGASRYDARGNPCVIIGEKEEMTALVRLARLRHKQAARKV